MESILNTTTNATMKKKRQALTNKPSGYKEQSATTQKGQMILVP